MLKKLAPQLKSLVGDYGKDLEAKQKAYQERLEKRSAEATK